MAAKIIQVARVEKDMLTSYAILEDFDTIALFNAQQLFYAYDGKYFKALEAWTDLTKTAPSLPNTETRAALVVLALLNALHQRVRREEIRGKREG